MTRTEAEVRRDHARLYEIWKGMCRRCHDPKRKDYAHYHGNRIYVCEEWRGTSDPHGWTHEGFLRFEQWALTHGYRDGLTLDRVANGGPYWPGNCRWISRKQQASNRSTNTRYTIDGKTRTIEQWSEVTGVPSYTICKRVAAGWSPKEAVFTPPRGRRAL